MLRKLTEEEKPEVISSYLGLLKHGNSWKINESVKKLVKNLIKMKKSSSTYSNGRFSITVSEEVKNHMSIHQHGEPCSGVLKHWGSKEGLIKELEEMIEALKKVG